MDFRQEYQSKLRTPDQAVQVVKSGDWVDYTVALGQPTLLDQALARRRDELTDVKIRGNLLLCPVAVAECDPSRELYMSGAGAARSMGHVCAPSLLQQVVARCAELPPELSAYEQNRELLFRELPAYGYRIARPDGAFYLFMQAPKGLSGQEFSQLAKEKYDILMAPAMILAVPTGCVCPIAWIRPS